MGKCVIRIIVNEERKKHEATYEDIIQYLWKNGAPGATAFRSTASIDDKKQLHYQLDSGIQTKRGIGETKCYHYRRNHLHDSRAGTY